MVYILIWVLYGYGYTTSGSAEFYSLENCNAAKIELRKNTYNRHRDFMECVKK